MSNQSYFVDVILPLPLKQLFTYAIPENLLKEVEVGKRIIVQFGSRKIYTAIVYSIHQDAPKEYQTKDIVISDDGEAWTRIEVPGVPVSTFYFGFLDVDGWMNMWDSFNLPSAAKNTMIKVK